MGLLGSSGVSFFRVSSGLPRTGLGADYAVRDASDWHGSGPLSVLGLLRAGGVEISHLTVLSPWLHRSARE
jgi:hypothetical protein